MRQIFSFLVVIFFLTACSQPASETTDNSGSDTTDTKMTVDPVEELTDRILENPNDPNLYVQRALAYRDRQMYKLAMRDVERAMSFDPASSYFHTLAGDIFFLEGDLRDARLSLEKAVQLDETNIDALLKLGEVYFLQHRYDEALESVNAALKLDDRLKQAYFIKGFVYKELGDTSLAKSSFQTAIEVDPEDYDSYMQLGSLYGYEGNPLALEYFNTAIELRPKSAEAYYHRGMFLQAGGKYDRALENYRTLIEADPDNFLGYYNTGYIYLTEKLAFDTALAYFDTVLTIRPDYVDALYNKGLCYEEMGLEGEAETHYMAVLEMDPQYDLAAKGLSRLRE